MSSATHQIEPEIAAWIAEQKLFFVATSPLAREGHINLSPKGGDSFRILGPQEAAYLDYTGSGAETCAHLRENGRFTIMFCAFSGPPQIVRLYGQGSVTLPGEPEFEALIGKFPDNAGARSIIRLSITRVSKTCGWAVPQYTYRGDRDGLEKWAATKGPERLAEYREANNRRSIDDLPAFE